MPYPLEAKVSYFLQQCTFKQLKQIHAFIVTTSLLHENIQIRLKFLRRSTEFGGMEYSTLIFSQMGGLCFNNEITLWNAMIRGFAYNGPFDRCISMYHEMRQRGLQSNNFTFPYVINSCTALRWFRTGEKVQCQIIKAGFESAFPVANSLFNLYLKMVEAFQLGVPENDRMNDVRKIFSDMCNKPVELWNRLITGYTVIGDIKRARQLFDNMPERDIVSWNSVISGYARVGDVANARDLFDLMPEKNVVSWTSMIGAYADCGDLERARIFFEEMPERNVVSWNSMISSYTRYGKFEEALDLFSRMKFEGVDSDGYTYVSALSACSHLGALEFGSWVHSLIEDWLNLAVTVGTALVEMYAKCGDVNRAFTVFIKIQNKDVFSYNVMIRSLAIHGRTQDAIKIFYLMQEKGLEPNDFTFTSALFACSHGGLVDEGREIFSSIKKKFGASPKLEHYGSMIDLLSRNDKVEEALVMVKEMPLEPDIAIWGALLGGCKVRGDLKLAELVIETAHGVNVNESGVFVLLSNIHASMGQWKEAIDARDKMEQKNIWKRTGCSNVL